VSLHTISAADAVARLSAFSAVIDARSEDEFAEDHLPGAVNWPSLVNAERAEVGTLYKQVNPFEAKKRGAALVAANIARHIQREVIDQPRDWQPLVYCWRGGKRSGSLAHVLGQIGFRVHLIEGGYKAFRAELLVQLPALAQRLNYRVICGPTGSGKTRLLQALAAEGAQVLDLEALASHRSSVLGLLPDQPQPSQKQFDTRIWSALRGFDAARPVYVESESKKVGNVAVPACLIDAIRASACLRLDLPDTERVELLMEDYDLFVRDPALFCSRLEALVPLRGHEVVERWKAWVAAGELRRVVQELLTLHYDPGYAASTQRNFRQFAQAQACAAANRSMPAMRTLAREILRTESDGLRG
jgi:tRNA 2-selenouridine synthase